jgi:hypothetical protein
MTAMMRRLMIGLGIGLALFLVLPFHFLAGWKWFGGIVLLKPFFPSSPAQHEIATATAFYSSSTTLLAQILLCLAIGLALASISFKKPKSTP